ncbi:MAG: TonB-dependent receptor plug domain-containing protein, partial [Opitutaceae bacterium]
MSPCRPLFVSLLCLGLLRLPASAQTAPVTPPPRPSSEKDGIQHLDKFVVSAGHDPKTAFDVAQGTSVLAGEELHRQVQATLGETLSGTPGVSSTYYGPGASRPVIRGLGGDRVRVLDNGVGALDASNVSPDHNTAVEPLFASRIEVLRGPSTLLYGSSAVGGAVNVIDNSIPDTAPDGRASGAAELRGGGAGRERAAVFSVGGGKGNFSTQLNLSKQRTSDLRIPGFARIDDDAPANQPSGTLPGSASDTFNGSLGGSVFWKAGHAGAAISRYETDYGVPTGDSPPTSIRMRRTRLDLAAETTQAFGVFRGAKARFGLADYAHSELGGSTVNTTITNKAWDSRLELPHAALGDVTGTLGVQATRSDFAARGEEVATPRSLTHSGAVFALEEMKLGEHATLQLGARYEGQTLKLGEVYPAS